MGQEPSPNEGYFLTCISGPDQGKRIALSAERLLVGRASDCNLLSDDADVTEYFADLNLKGDRLRIRALSTTLPFVDGHPVSEATLGPRF